MGDTTEIAWTDSTFNPWIGCTKVSAGCKNCYASVETFTRRERARGIELWGENAARHVTSDANWRKPLAWNREAAKAGVRRRVFCASLSDVFEDRPDLAAPRARLWSLIEETPNLDWLVLTKRPENADRLWRKAALAPANVDKETDAPVWGANIWLGTTVEDQRRADERIPHLLCVPAAVRFLSCEPLLEAVDLFRCATCAGSGRSRAGHMICPDCFGSGREKRGRKTVVGAEMPSIDWVIVGGESGHHARLFDVAWARLIVSQCREAGTAVFVKQLGARPGADGVEQRLRDKKGGDMSEWPADLRVRESPASAVAS